MRGKVPALPQAMMGRTFRVVDACNFELRNAGGGGAGGLEDDFVGGACGGGLHGGEGAAGADQPFVSLQSQQSAQQSDTRDTS